MHDGRGTVSIETPDAHYRPVILGLRGEHQVQMRWSPFVFSKPQNTRSAIPPRRDAIERGLVDVDWPGRLELIRMPDGAQALLDAAHNGEAHRHSLPIWAMAPGTPDARHRDDARQARLGHR